MKTIFAALFATLLLATAIGWHLARRRPSPQIDNLNARIRAWWVMIAIGGLALALGHPALTTLFAILSWLALREFTASTPNPPRWLFATIPAQYLAIAFHWHYPSLLLLPLLALLLPRPHAQGLLLCVYGLSAIPALGHPEWMLYLVLVVQASDVLQYLWGRLIGRHKVAPKISPSKTIEGLAGGILTATALGAWLHPLTPYSPWGATCLALLLTTTGFASGLLLSAIKRQRNLKDWGTALPGHGGILDRVDSLCLSAPLFYAIVRLL